MENRISSWLRDVTPPADALSAEGDGVVPLWDEPPELPPLVAPGPMFRDLGPDGVIWQWTSYRPPGWDPATDDSPFDPIPSPLHRPPRSLIEQLPIASPRSVVSASPRPSHSGSSVLSKIRSVCSSIHQWTTRKRKRKSPSLHSDESPSASTSESDSCCQPYIDGRAAVATERNALFSRLKKKFFPDQRESADLSNIVATDPVTVPAGGTSKQVSRTMSAAEVMALLSNHGCIDLTGDLDEEGFSSMPISGGGFGDVYRGKLRNGLLVAIKCPRWFSFGIEQSQGVLKDMARELHTWSKCKHFRVIELLGMVGFRNQIAMVSPWMENGTMPQYLDANLGASRHELCKQIAEAVMYLHGEDVVHGDIKGANVLISEHGSAKLGDFGNSVLKHASLQFTGASHVPSFSIRWAAPELLKGDVKSSKPADIYALGMTILEAFTGNVPYFGLNDCAVLCKVITGKELPPKPDVVEELIWRTLLKCWRGNPTKRLTIHRISMVLRIAKLEDDVLRLHKRARME